MAMPSAMLMRGSSLIVGKEAIFRKAYLTKWLFILINNDVAAAAKLPVSNFSNLGVIEHFRMAESPNSLEP